MKPAFFLAGVNGRNKVRGNHNAAHADVAQLAEQRTCQVSLR